MQSNKTTRGLLAIAAWILLPVWAWALPPCTLCSWLPPGHLCFDANGDLDHCPFFFAASDETVAIADLGFEIDEPGPFLGFEPGEDVFRASTVLSSKQTALVTVRNPAIGAIEVQVRTRAFDGSTRTVAVELGASDRLTFDLQPSAIYLVATSRSAFELELENPKTLERTRLSPSQPFLKLGVGGDCDDNENPGDPCEPDPPGGGSVFCDTDWTLTCDVSRSSGCANLGPYTHAGEVKIVGTQRHVYWNLNTPTGDYTTTTNQGLTAIWHDAIGDPDICPNTVVNNLGHWYDITQ